MTPYAIVDTELEAEELVRDLQVLLRLRAIVVQVGDCYAVVAEEEQ